jgi:hypothetical protein
MRLKRTEMLDTTFLLKTKNEIAVERKGRSERI